MSSWQGLLKSSDPIHVCAPNYVMFEKGHLANTAWITYRVVTYRVNLDVGLAFFGTNMYLIDGQATGYRVNLDIG